MSIGSGILFRNETNEVQGTLRSKVAKPVDCRTIVQRKVNIDVIYGFSLSKKLQCRRGYLKQNSSILKLSSHVY